ncbi:MAG: hydrogenase expression/formation protein HypE [Spirochaetia bacterium]|nr:hydrogenase expression/formation protein HypE [Spirochaetota bacterium]MDW8112293.1 hydrogenase expression/formation protein HypE [Spirochaetia bacterium]
MNFDCPSPTNTQSNERIRMAHGGGGRLMNNLIERVFKPILSNEYLDELHDGAILQLPSQKIAFSTDSFVISPLFFPGGDIGKLAVNGTVNDLAMCGARPMFLSLGLIIEEGFEMEKLNRILQSVHQASQKVGVKVVTGDTKVVNKGKGDGIYINTAGIGVIEHNLNISPRSVKEGDVIVLSGDIGRHGSAIMALREGIELDTTLESDCDELWTPVSNLLSEGIEIHCLRDLTRGGLVSALNEISRSSGFGIYIYEESIPVVEEVKAICEILGLDPLYVANEGRFISIVPENYAERAVSIISNTSGTEARVIGKVTSDNSGKVIMKSLIGSNRLLDMLSGEQLPRIC